MLESLIQEDFCTVAPNSGEPLPADGLYMAAGASYAQEMSGRTALPWAIALTFAGTVRAQDLAEEQRRALSAAIGTQRCQPAADPNEIVVCAPRDERYRLPPSPPAPGTKGALSVSQERKRLYDYDFGGIGSCSAVGPGGVSGCLKRNIENSRN